MTAQELEKLLMETTPGPWFALRNAAFWEVNPFRNHGDDHIPYTVADCCASDPEDTTGLQEKNARLIAMAPTLARRVIAAEKLVDALSLIADGHSWQRDIATDALAEWESAQ